MMTLGRGPHSPCLVLAGLAAVAVAALVSPVSLHRSPAEPAGAPPITAFTLPAQEPLLSGEEQALVQLINDYRVQSGVPPLAISPTLSTVAAWTSRDMATNDYFDLTDSLGRDPFRRMADLGYPHNTWKGENPAAGCETAADTFDLWRRSPWHNSNMLNPDFVVIGVARAQDPGSTYGWYWTAAFGGSDDDLADL